MGEDQEDEDILELTDDMKSVPPPAPGVAAGDAKIDIDEPPAAGDGVPPARVSTPPVQPVSPLPGPFKLLATPKPRGEEPEEEAPRESRPDAKAYVPHKSAVAVTASPIMWLGSAPSSAGKIAKKAPAPEPVAPEEPSTAKESTDAESEP